MQRNGVVFISVIWICTQIQQKPENITHAIAHGDMMQRGESGNIGKVQWGTMFIEKAYDVNMRVFSWYCICKMPRPISRQRDIAPPETGLVCRKVRFSQFIFLS